MYATFGFIAFCSLGLVACLSARKHLRVGETGVIGGKDTVLGTTDRESYESLTKALQTDDKVAQVQLMVHGQLVRLSPGTKLKVVATYEYMGTNAYKAEMTEKFGEDPDESWTRSVFVNAYYVDAVK
jgi:hypothetical protein